MKGNFVTIVKDGKLINTDEDNLCREDMVVLQTGDLVPADLKLVEARGLEIDEFEITGEIMPVFKKVDAHDVMIYMGSRVVRGTGKGIVVATGERTEYGRVLSQGWEQNKNYEFRIFKKNHLGLLGLVLPAFIIHLAQSNNDIAVIAFYLLLSIILILLQSDDLFRYFLISKELNYLRRFNIQIRDRDVRTLEGMNEIDVICFDKTGVLTTRQLDVKNIYFAGKLFETDNVFQALEEGTAHLVKLACALCHDVLYFEKMALANPIDKALINFAQKNGINVNEILLQFKRVYDQPFDSENRYMASGFEIDGKEYYFAKGDPGVILRMCNRYLIATGVKKKLDFEFWLSLNSYIESISKNGDTAIALAYTSDNPDKTPLKYTFLCLLQLGNSLQPGVRETMKGITEKGIRSILLTGDRAETAAKISADSGVSKNSKVYLTGRTIERMELSEVARQSAYCSVFARMLPSQKGVLIRLLQQRGHCVAMVGDGPNDGIALKVADIGISFVKNSSPIARRLSRILINDLADLLKLIEGAHRIKRRAMHLKLFRILILVVSLLNIYICVFTSQYF
jgi:Ca2+-transporting ATPase